MYMYVCTCMYVHVCNVHVSMYMYVCTFMYNVHACVRVYMCAYVCACVQACNICMDACMQYGCISMVSGTNRLTPNFQKIKNSTK